MRHQVLIFGLLLSAALAPIAIGQEVRGSAVSQAEVISSMATAQSGPSNGYYPTSTLKQGELLTVVAARSDGWVAVLPPKLSFSLVRAGDVQEDADGNAIAKKDFVEVRIGTAFSEAHFVTQVSVDSGEKLQILDEVMLDEGGKKEKWYKVVPPKNEVRYVRKEAIRIRGDSIASPVVQQNPAAAPVVNTPAGQTRLIAKTGIVGKSIIPPAKPMRQNSRQVSVSASPYSGDEPPVEVTDRTDLSVEQRIKNLSNQLAVMKTRSPSAWDLEGAKRIASSLRATASSQSLDSAENLMSEIRRMEDVRDRYVRQIRTRDRAIERDNELARLQIVKQQSMETDTRRFAAQGILKRTSSDLDTRIGFVLENDGGMTTHYVLPLPGLNLERYVGQRVGLDGQVTSRPGMPIPTVTIEQLTPLVGTSSGRRDR